MSQEVNISGEKSAFNFGFATLERLNKILNDIEIYSFTNDYASWSRKLISLYKELRPFTEKDNTLRKLMDDKISYAKILDKRLAFNKRMVNRMEAEEKLMDIELFLRDIIKIYDLLIARKDDPKYAVLQK